MARSKPPQLQKTTLSVEQMRAAIPKLDRRINDLESFDISLVKERQDPHIESLIKKVDGTLHEIFGSGSIEYNDYAVVSLDSLPFNMFGDPYPLNEIRENCQSEVRRSVMKLRTLRELLEERIADALPANDDSMARARKSPSLTSKRVFVVHGHDDGTKETVARYLSALDLNPIILHEQPNQGKTIIEKFEANSDVAFAVVLLTPDDVGYSKSDPSKASPRARQNVVLEMGFFMGTLGRSHVCVLYKEGVEIPSDYQGVTYIPLDAGGAWKLLVAREIKSAGIDIDMNKALK